jgi:hypothetical protein
LKNKKNIEELITHLYAFVKDLRDTFKECSINVEVPEF